jgi:uncharacterized protein YggE
MSPSPRAARRTLLGRKVRSGLPGGLLGVASAALLLGAALSLTVERAPAYADNPPNGITVSGSGTAELPPDVAHVSGSVDTQAATADDALSQNSQTMQAVISAIKGFGIADADIVTTRVSISPVFSSSANTSSNQPSPPPTIVGYRASNGVRVKISDLSKVGDLIQAMVGAGINNFNGVDYGLQNPEQLRVMSLQAAIADAQQQAQAAASALGVKLGGVLNSTTQFTSAPPVPRAAVASFAAAPAPPPPPVMPGPQSATTNVTVTYAILGQ